MTAVERESALRAAALHDVALFIEPPVARSIVAALDTLRSLEAQVAAARAVHPREVYGERVVCGWCRDSSEEPWEWPCPTMNALDGAS